MATIEPINWLNMRKAKLSFLRHKLLNLGFGSEIVESHDGTEEFLAKEINGKIYVMAIHHTFVDWYFEQKTAKYSLPMYEGHFLRTIQDYQELLHTLDTIGKEHEDEPTELYYCNECDYQIQNGIRDNFGNCPKCGKRLYKSD